MSRLLRRFGAILLLIAVASFWVWFAQRSGRQGSRTGAAGTFFRADSLKQAGDLESALAEYQNRLTEYRLVGDKAGQAYALYEIGTAQYNLERYSEALSSWREALQTFEELDDRPRVAQTLKNLGWIYDDLADYPQAIRHYQRSLEIARALGNRLLEAQNLNNLGVAYRNLARFPEALQHFEQSLQIRRKLSDRTGEANTLNNIGMVYDDQSSHIKALDCYQQCLKIFTDLKDREGAARVLGNMGVAYKSLSDYTRALEYHRRSLELKRVSGDKKGEAVTLHNIGVVYDLLYDFEQAMTYYEESLQISRHLADRNGEAATLDNIGAILATQGRFADAQQFHQRSLTIRRQTGDRKGEGIALSNLGYVSFKMGNFEDARNFYRRDLDICRELGDRSGECVTLADLGTLSAAMREDQQAEAYLLRALKHAQAEGIPNDLLLAYAALGNYHLLQGNPKSAVADFGKAVDLLENMRSRLQVEAQKTSFASGGADLFEAMITALVQMGDGEAAFHYVERSKARSFLDLLAAGGVKTAGDEASVPESIEAERTAGILGGQEPELRSPVSVEALTIKEIQKLLPPDVTLVEYYVTRDQTLIWRVTNSEVGFYRMPVGDDSLKKLIDGLRDEILYLGNSRFLPEVLYSILLAPCGDLSDGELIVVPDGILHYLPFVVLRNPEGGWIADRCDLSTLPSASTLKYLRRRDTPQLGSLLAFGNPSIVNAEYPPLPYAEREVKSIASHFAVSKIFTRKAAKESRLLQLAADFDVIHLACHSDLNSAYPLYSRLLLAPDQAQDGELSVYEIFHLPIQANLVVLSACRTGLGKRTNGDEIVGLSRAFLAAGASAVLVSLWRVDDAAAAELMTKFYAYLRQYPLAESLRRAQADCRCAGADMRAWAPFVLISGSGENPLN